MMEIPFIAAAVGLLTGLTIGAAYFALLHRAARLQMMAAPLRRSGPLHLARGLLAVGGFWALVQLGVWPLLAGLAGFLTARLLAIHLVRET